MRHRLAAVTGRFSGGGSEVDDGDQRRHIRESRWREVVVRGTAVRNLFHTNSLCQRPVSSSNLGRSGISFRVVDGRDFEITVLRRKGYQPFVVSATGKKNHDNNSSSSGVWNFVSIWQLHKAN
ncbi:hypothetical protein SESBI_28836 [Sesbania bispinosa]|nr:hypothetical protein SESBI_28836 [Sesbania bispinosa]